MDLTHTKVFMSPPGYMKEGVEIIFVYNSARRMKLFDLAGCRLHLGFVEKLVLKVGFYLKAVFPSRNLGLM